MLRLVAERGIDKTICPSELARHLGGPHPDDWRPLMEPIKRVAIRLAARGKVEIRRKGQRVVDIDDLHGIYRLGLPRRS